MYNYPYLPRDLSYLLLTFMLYQQSTVTSLIEYNAVSNRMMKSHTIHQNARYMYEICNHQVLLKKSLARHKMIVHERLRYSCKKCKYQATSKRSLFQHQRAVHEGIQYHCRQCNYQFSREDSLVQHQRVLHITWRNKILLRAVHLSGN